MNDELLKPEQIMVLLKCCRATMFNYIRQGLFPEPIKISARSIRWPSSVVKSWLENKGKQFNKQKESWIDEVVNET